MHRAISTTRSGARTRPVGLPLSAVTTALILTLGLPTAAGAQPAQPADPQFGRSGTLVLSAERLFGVVSSTVSVEEMGVEGTVTTTSIDLGLRQTASPWSVPRLAFDGFATDGLSLGAAAGFSTSSFSAGASSGSANADIDLGSAWTLVLAPRVGYAHMFSEAAGIWPRAGLSFYFGGFGSEDGPLSEQDLDGDGTPDLEISAGDVSMNGMALSVELPLVITPTPHVLILVSPTLDFGLSGSTSTEGVETSEATDQDFEVTDFGLQFGLGAWF